MFAKPVVEYVIYINGPQSYKCVGCDRLGIGATFYQQAVLRIFGYFFNNF